MSANLAISAGIAGEIDVLGSIGSAIRSIQRGAPLRVIGYVAPAAVLFGRAPGVWGHQGSQG